MLHPIRWPGSSQERTDLWQLALLGRRVSGLVIESAEKFWDAKCSVPMEFPGQQPLRWLDTEWEDTGRMWKVIYKARDELRAKMPGLTGSASGVAETWL